MKSTSFTPTLLVIAALLGACGSLPKTTTLLDQTRSDYQIAQGNPKVASFASLELKQAGDALALANAAASNNDSSDQIDKLAYLAKQKIALTQEVAKQKSAEAEVAGAGRERDQVRLDQRTSEANQARASAEQSKVTAQVAQADAIEAQRKTEEALAQNTKLEAQLAELAAKQTERGLVITLGDVLFGSDQARLNESGTRSLRKLADVLQGHPLRTVMIEGFTDSTGTSAHNQELSERRTGAVRDTLQEMGIARDRIATRAYGEAYPVAGNDTATNRQLNRRVEIVISPGNTPITQR